MARPQRKVEKRSARELLSGADLREPAQPAAKKQKKDAPKAKKETTKKKPVVTSVKGNQRVRVWWPPTDNKTRTGYSGAFWPAAVTGRTRTDFRVRYDNGDEELVSSDHVFPEDAPIGFGEEIEDLLAGEFVEVSNGSKTDPCAWLGVVKAPPGAGAGAAAAKCLVTYPFHDAPDERVARALLRRARIWDGDEWKVIRPGQKWKDGEVVSPRELDLLSEDDFLARFLDAAAKPAGGAGGGKKGGKAAGKAADGGKAAGGGKKKATPASAAKGAKAKTKAAAAKKQATPAKKTTPAKAKTTPAKAKGKATNKKAASGGVSKRKAPAKRK